MSDLSWLNPTSHAIAVYASRPLSPVAAQHSLPSGRYSLLGPDFHRLDRTSLRLAHSLDHLVGAREHRDRRIETERLRRYCSAGSRHCGVPPFFLHTDRNFLRALPCRPLALA
jgi:hypothetical protein